MKMWFAALPALVVGLAPAVPGRPAQEAPRVLVISGANNHHWEFTSRRLLGMLAWRGKFRVDLTVDPAATLADAAAIADYDAFVLDYNGPRWGEAAEKNFVEAVRGGTGIVVVHAANNAFPGWVEYEEMVGHLWREGTGHGRFHPFDVEVTDRDHPVTRDLADFVDHPDELYHGLVNVRGTSHRVLATAFSSEESGGSGESEPMIMVGVFGDGRVFHTPLGHVWRGNKPSRASYADYQFRDLIVRGTEWAATGRVTTGSSAPNTLTPDEEADGWRLLFDGETTTGWRGFKQSGFPEKGWEVRDGALVVAGGGGVDLITEDTFGNFQLELEFKVAPKANSGIMYRVTEDEGATWFSGPEFQVLDDALFEGQLDPLHSVGALYDLAEVKNRVVRVPGAWNRARITVDGWRVRHELNGYEVVDLDLASPLGQTRIHGSKFADMESFAKAERGHLALQDHGDEVWFRSIKLRDLDEHRERALFDGESLDGWAFHLADDTDPSEVWSVADGVLVCRGTPAGYIQTERDFANFVLTLEWRWSPETKQAGNSGVLFRKIGEDKVWPRSIEAQLQSERAGDFWLIAGFPMKPAPDRTEGRNTRATHYNENPVGEWNRYVITVDGGDVTLEVNGQVVNEATGALEVPGRVCLQSEGAEIHFRDIRLKTLD